MTRLLSRQDLNKEVLWVWLGQYRLSLTLLGIWIISMISLPIAKWIAGVEIIPYMVTLSAILQAIAVFTMTQDAWGWRYTAWAFGAVAFIGWAAEFIGHSTGIPFGDYGYSGLLQPQIGGVPLLIPIAWFMLFPPAWAVSQVIIGKRDTWQKQIAFIAMSAVALTAWDLFLDPQMVAWGFWEWAYPYGYFGIPFSNYVGWLIVSAIMTAVVRPKDLPILPLGIVYAVVWFLQTFGQAIFWGQVGPAIFGGVAMGSIMIWAYLRHK